MGADRREEMGRGKEGEGRGMRQRRGRGRGEERRWLVIQLYKF